MRRICMFLGLLCIMAAFLLTGYNLFTDYYFGKEAAKSVEEFVLNVEKETEVRDVRFDNLRSFKIAGSYYVGVLEIPSLNLTIPVLSDASSESLNVGAGVYHGSPYTKDFVIGAHNRLSFFNGLNSLKPGDVAYFMDGYGEIFVYEAIAMEVIPEEMVEVMIDSGYDLSLFTCDLSNTKRVTVRFVKDK